jgi:UDP-glucose 4-epimerase
VLAGENQFDGVYNLGTSEAYDFNTVGEMLNDELGTDIEAEYIKNLTPDSVYVHNTCADYSKMKAENWVGTTDQF